MGLPTFLSFINISGKAHKTPTNANMATFIIEFFIFADVLFPKVVPSWTGMFFHFG